MPEVTKDRFLSDVKNHSIKVYKDDGLYRHIELSNNGSFNQKYYLTTWPGYLSITGDMGNYMFSRIPDMFEFFRTQCGLRINLSYWDEKCVSVSRFGGDFEFSRALLRKKCLARLSNEDLVRESYDEVLYELQNSVFMAENAIEAYDALARFDSHGVNFPDYWEMNFRRATYHYVWVMYAVTWGIKQYDIWREENNEK